MPAEKRKDVPDRESTRPPASPYGPQPNGPDEAAGGADSSPFETLSSDERDRLLREKRPQDEEPRH